MPDKTFLSQLIVDRMERIGKTGHWRWTIKENELFWSRGVFDIHGLDFKKYTPDVETAIDAYVKEDRQIVEDALAYAIENKKSFKFECRICRPDGEIRHVISQGECDISDTGELTALFGVIQDITAIKQQEELYELSALGSNSALWDWTIAEDKLRWAGRSAQVLGYALNENLPQSTRSFFETLVHEDDKEILKAAFKEHFTKLTNFNIEIRIKRQDGQYEWFIARAQAQFSSDVRAIRVCGSMTSIQKLKETQKKLENSNSDLENFACMAAHEIKSPIRSIASYMELIQLSANDLPDTLKEYIQKSVEIANQTGKMVDEILEYASLEDARLNLSDVNIDILTKLIIRSMKDDVKQSNAKISFGDLPVIHCDETKIKTVLTNLIQNAIKYHSDKPPEIHIDVIQNNDYWQYSVKDNGRGIPQNYIDKAFTMFERADNIEQVKGTGIGLAICKRIIDLHKGDIWIESELNQGSTFYFTLPKPELKATA